MELDPDTKALLDRLAAAKAPPVSAVPLEVSRAALKTLTLELDRPATDGVATTAITIPGRDGDVPATLHRREQGSSGAPIAVYLHGGGWVRGDAEMYDGLCRYLAAEAGCVVLNVDYRLAPEHRFPAGLADSYDVVRWAAANGDALDADSGRIAVLGDSAGGNFAAVIAQLAADDGLPLAAQGLIYPATDLRPDSDGLYPSRKAFDDIYYFLDLERLHWYVDAYLGGPDDALDPRVSPILAEDVGNVAPAFVLTAGCDVLRDEGAAYATKLETAGVPVDYTCFPGTVHAFMSFSKSVPIGLEAQAWIAARLRAALHGKDA